MMKGTEGNPDYAIVGSCKGLDIGVKPIALAGPQVMTIGLGFRVRAANPEGGYANVEKHLKGSAGYDEFWMKKDETRVSGLSLVQFHSLALYINQDEILEFFSSVESLTYFLEGVPLLVGVKPPKELSAYSKNVWDGELSLMFSQVAEISTKLLADLWAPLVSGAKKPSPGDASTLAKILGGIDITGGTSPHEVKGVNYKPQGPKNEG
ncbi:MAG: hypothetical protein GWN00_01280 [Aliifodinibius sp.]|nr:hypothetical protein [Fodinibius sp.]NIY23494.1 hypothetical protein [Fodinibius sp.]